MSPPALAILPSDLLAPAEASSSSSSSAVPPHHRLLRLPNARTGLPSLFLVARQSSPGGKQQVLEVQRVAPDAERSWFVGDEVVQDGRLLVFNLIDPVFLLLPIVLATTASPSRFLLADHLFSTAASSSAFKLPPPFANAAGSKGKGRADESERSVDEGEVDDVLCLAQLEGVEKLLGRVCDVKQVADDLVAYRFSEAKTHAYLRRKVERLARRETFDRFGGLRRLLAKDGLVGLEADGENAKAAQGEKEDERLEKIREEARLHYALTTLQSYLPPSLLASLTASFSASSEPPFPLYRAHLASLAPSLGSTSSFAAEIEEEKALRKREKENEKKRKAAPVSQGVGKLKKANTSGMGKLTGFFKPKPKEETKG